MEKNRQNGGLYLIIVPKVAFGRIKLQKRQRSNRYSLTPKKKLNG